jgi:hypothetical protein
MVDGIFGMEPSPAATTLYCPPRNDLQARAQVSEKVQEKLWSVMFCRAILPDIQSIILLDSFMSLTSMGWTDRYDIWGVKTGLMIQIPFFRPELVVAPRYLQKVYKFNNSGWPFILNLSFG